METKGDLIKIIEEFKSVLEETDLRISEEVLFKEANRLFISNKIQLSKEKNIESIKKEPATKKQLWKLEKMKIKFPNNISKKEAYELIKENENTRG